MTDRRAIAYSALSMLSRAKNQTFVNKIPHNQDVAAVNQCCDLTDASVRTDSGLKFSVFTMTSKTLHVHTTVGFIIVNIFTRV